MPSRTVRRVFDESYYRRFYGDLRTRAVSPQESERCAAFVCSYLRHLELPVSRVLDLGCGLGRLLEGVQSSFPQARCVGVEVSDYLCESLGWVKGSVVDFRSNTPFDLVICHDVLQYLCGPKAKAAIANLQRLTRGALYLGVLTREDWEHNCDRSRTDGDVYLRSAGWYRRELKRGFISVGGGLFLRQPEPVTVWSLERA